VIGYGPNLHPQSYEPATPQQNLLDSLGQEHRTWHKRNTSLQVAGQPARRRGRPQLSAQLSYTAGHDKHDPAKALLLKLTCVAIIAAMPMKKVRSQIVRMSYASLGEVRKLKLSDRRAT
jgi:hypothetical protein